MHAVRLAIPHVLLKFIRQVTLTESIDERFRNMRIGEIAHLRLEKIRMALTYVKTNSCCTWMHGASSHAS